MTMSGWNPTISLIHPPTNLNKSHVKQFHIPRSRFTRYMYWWLNRQYHKIHGRLVTNVTFDTVCRLWIHECTVRTPAGSFLRLLRKPGGQTFSGVLDGIWIIDSRLWHLLHSDKAWCQSCTSLVFSWHWDSTSQVLNSGYTFYTPPS